MPTLRRRPGRPKGSGTIGGERFTVRLPALLMARLEAYCQGTHAGLSPLRMTDVVRVALEHYLNARGGHSDAIGGPVLAPTEDLSPHCEDQSSPKAAPSKDQQRTTGRKGRKRVQAAQEG
jgi:hypothetical protein